MENHTLIRSTQAKGKWPLEIISNIIQVPKKDIQGLTLKEYCPQMLLLLDQVAWRIFAVAESGQKINDNLISEGHQFTK